MIDGVIDLTREERTLLGRVYKGDVVIRALDIPTRISLGFLHQARLIAAVEAGPYSQKKIVMFRVTEAGLPHLPEGLR